ncbi:unnamed protein product [Ixodes hexagonus]
MRLVDSVSQTWTSWSSEPAMSRRPDCDRPQQVKALDSRGFWYWHTCLSLRMSNRPHVLSSDAVANAWPLAWNCGPQSSRLPYAP